ncbi:hypothetical protein HPB49_019155 [Dermacentor silvarum]|uniref:Uncharacterized protein n=2 Tax=Dermacentor silvarum TaxID=543639 RepID=A0ACB8C545_DERSI|nr:hypothetical protein HPB49_019155 [Dermacentor silvarum]
MAYCCVPNCKSDGKHKIAGVSFHEIPAESTLREAWIRAIDRPDWTPNVSSNYSRVCSKHFKDEDFTNGQRRRLKKGIVPALFPERSSKVLRAPAAESTIEHIGHSESELTQSKEMNNSASVPETPMELERSTEKEQRAQSSSIAVQEQLCAPPRAFDEEADNNSDIVVQEAQMDEEEESCSLYANEKAKWLRKEREMKRKIDRLQNTVDRYKSELEKVKEDCNFADMSYIRQQAKQKDTSAVFLWNQIINFRRKKPTWSEDVVRHCIILRHLSTKAYEHARKERLLKLPSRTTLQEFLGGTSGEAGFNSLIKLRLKAESEKLTSPASRHCSLIMDEMRIKPKLQYNKQQDCFVGHAAVGEADDPANEPLLANSLLCFLINGLSTSYRITVSYFFTKSLSGSQLSQLVRSVIKNVEESGFKVDRLVADNHKINVSAMTDLCGGFLTYRIEHPIDPDRLLFLSFDCCHVLKNVRSQFLEREIGPDGEISSRYLKKIYDLQKEMIVKPVRKLTRKHVFPNNIEKMNVKRALEIFSPSVTAALEF